MDVEVFQAEVSGDSRPCLSGAVAVDVGATAFLFGGKDTSGAHVNEGWSFLKESARWDPVEFSGPVPHPREGHSLTLLDENHILLFGGFDGAREFDDCHVLDLRSMTWSAVAAASPCKPSKRSGHTMVHLSPGYVLLFGGFDGSRYHNDGFMLQLGLSGEEFASGTWTQVDFRGSVPCERSAFASGVMCRAEIPELIVFGGFNGFTNFNDMYILNTVTLEWTQMMLEPDIPEPCMDTCMVHLSGDRFLLWGGAEGADSFLLQAASHKCVFLPEREEQEGALPSRPGCAAVRLSPSSVLLWGGQDAMDGEVLNDGLILQLPDEPVLSLDDGRMPSVEAASPGASEDFQYHLNPDRRLGGGTFGEVFEGIITSGPMTGVKVAIKVINMAEDSEEAKVLRREIDLMRELRHPNITCLLYVRTVNRKVHIVMELCDESMAGMLKLFNGKGMPLDLVRDLTTQMLHGLDYLHSMRIVHRDLKPNNVLLVEADGHRIVKLADFGCSKQLEKGTAAGTNEVGTMAYCAPEVIRPDEELNRTVYGFKVDVWSLGCTVLELLTGKSPYEQATNVFAVMFRLTFQKSPPDIPEDLDPVARDFISQCLQ